MLQRIFAMLIVGFWLAMTGMLVIREFYPEATRLNQVPVSYVGKLIFQHKQSSDLQIHDAGKDVGYVHLQPRVFPESKTRSLEYQGKVYINPLGMSRQQLSWSGAFNLDENNDVKSLHIGVSTQDPEHQLLVNVDSEASTAKFTLRSNGQLVDQSSISLDRQGVAKLIERMGLDPSLLQQLQSPSGPAASPEITAHQSSTKLNGEVVSTYLVSIKMGGQTILEAHVSPLGQVLRAQAPLFGYKLVPYNIAP